MSHWSVQGSSRSTPNFRKQLLVTVICRKVDAVEGEYMLCSRCNYRQFRSLTQPNLNHRADRGTHTHGYYIVCQN